MKHLYITSTVANATHLAYRKTLKSMVEDDDFSPTHNPLGGHEPKEDALEHPHEKNICDFFAWHIGVHDAKWYVKPRSTCWFED